MKHITILANITDLKQSLEPKRKKKFFKCSYSSRKSLQSLHLGLLCVSYTVLKSLLNFFHFCYRLNAESYLFLESFKDTNFTTQKKLCQT